jgi:hypothetical protein
MTGIAKRKLSGNFRRNTKVVVNVELLWNNQNKRHTRTTAVKPAGTTSLVLVLLVVFTHGMLNIITEKIRVAKNEAL